MKLLESYQDLYSNILLGSYSKCIVGLGTKPDHILFSFSSQFVNLSYYLTSSGNEKECWLQETYKETAISTILCQKYRLRTQIIEIKKFIDINVDHKSSVNYDWDDFQEKYKAYCKLLEEIRNIEKSNDDFSNPDINCCDYLFHCKKISEAIEIGDTLINAIDYEIFEELIAEKKIILSDNFILQIVAGVSAGIIFSLICAFFLNL